MLVRGLSATQRLARHLWRMCFSLFIGSGSIFLARPHLFTRFLQETNILLLLGVLPLILLIFWIIRIRVTTAYSGRHASATDRRHYKPSLASQAELS
jgi:cadmium resistance protein CadD (predicted permease)